MTILLAEDNEPVNELFRNAQLVPDPTLSESGHFKQLQGIQAPGTRSQSLFLTPGS
jgi:hypothetical protein